MLKIQLCITEIAFFLFLYLCATGAILGRSETQECVFYNASWEKEGTNQSGVESCYREKDKRQHCFSTWKNRSGAIEMVKQGCWLDDVNCYDSSECVERKENPDVFFCCCEGNMCNKKFHYNTILFNILNISLSLSLTHSLSLSPATSNPVPPKPDLFATLLYSLIPVMAVAVILIISFWMYRRLKLSYPPLLVPSQNKQSWQSEYEIYSLSGMKHENILHFIGAEKRGNGVDIELWLITAYHEKKIKVSIFHHDVKSSDTSEGLAMLFETIEECWDHEAEARLSAGCVEERIISMQRNTNLIAPDDILSVVTMVTNLDFPPKESSL
uniref:Activin A receptor type 2Ab n=1 Tax=Cyprinus carpio TaxID=7962 RepID=A0A8C1KLP9_CYPCA